MSTRKWYAIGIVLAALVVGTVTRIFAGRSLAVDLVTAGAVLAAIIIAVLISRQPVGK